MTYTLDELLELQTRFALEQPDAELDAFELWLEYECYREDTHANASN